MVLAVVPPDALAPLEDAHVEAELPERALALEGAPASRPIALAPARLGRVDDEPAVDVRNEPVLRLAERRLFHGPKATRRPKIPRARDAGSARVTTLSRVTSAARRNFQLVG